MASKLEYLIGNIKNINAAAIIKTIRSTQENLKVGTVVHLASHVVAKAKDLSAEEMINLFEKISQIEQKTNAGISKVVSIMVDKLLKNKAQEPVSEEVRNEIVHQFAEYNKGKNLIPIFKYVNTVLLTNLPKNVKSAKGFKKNVADTLIKDAHKRLEKNN